jgi:hypothetical protein
MPPAIEIHKILIWIRFLPRHDRRSRSTVSFIDKSADVRRDVESRACRSALRARYFLYYRSRESASKVAPGLRAAMNPPDADDAHERRAHEPQTP